MPEAGKRPLDGVRVLCLAQQYPGPYATLLLSDLGADVIIVERPDGGDPARRFPEFFAALNRGKRSVALDLKRKEDQDACRALAARSDVLIEGFRPGVAARLGLDSTVLRAEHPELVYVSISGFGQDGPYRDRPAHDLSYMALAGLLEDPGDGHGPRVPMLSMADLCAGLFGAIAALTGIAAVARGGRGATYDVAMFDTLVSLLTSVLGQRFNATAPEGFGQDPGYGVYATADGRWLTLSIAFENHFWQRLCGAVGLEDLAELDTDERAERRTELRRRLAATLATRPLAAWETVLGAADVPHAPVQTPDDLGDDPQVIARRLFLNPPGSDRTFVRQPLIVQGMPFGPERDAPALGEHTEAILAEVGMAQPAAQRN